MVTAHTKRWIIPVTACLAVALAGCNSEDDIFLKEAAIPDCEAVDAPPFIALSKNGGATFNAGRASMPTGAPDDAPYADLLLSRTQPGLMFIRHNWSISQSTDGGCTWQDVLDLAEPSVEGSLFYDIAMAEETAYVLTDADPALEWDFSLYAIDGGGASTEIQPPQSFSTDVWIKSSAADETALYLHAANESLWRRVAASGEWELVADGLADTRRLIGISPMNRTHMIFSGNDTPAYVSIDSAATLEAVSLPQGTADEITLFTVEFGDGAETIWGFGRRIWRDAASGEIVDREDVVMFSTDGGFTFDEAFVPDDEGISGAFVTARPGSGSELLVTDGPACPQDGMPRVHTYRLEGSSLVSESFDLPGVLSFGRMAFSPFNSDIVYAVQLHQSMCDTVR